MNLLDWENSREAENRMLSNCLHDYWLCRLSERRNCRLYTFLSIWCWVYLYLHNSDDDSKHWVYLNRFYWLYWFWFGFVLLYGNAMLLSAWRV